MASFLGMLVTASVMSSSMAYRNVLGKDIARTRLNQNLRGGMDIVGSTIRIAGENLTSTFPAVELVNGTSDELILRRNLMDEVLPVCTSINAGTSTSQIYFAVPGNVAGCVYSGHLANYQAWRDYRLSQGGAIKAFIYNTTTKTGEFFNYTGETDTGTSYYLTASGQTWSANYPAGGASVYILEEWRFSLDEDLLQIVIDRDFSNPSSLAFDVTDFEVLANMQDGSSLTALSNTAVWTSLANLNVTISGSDRFRGQALQRDLSAQFFPRNILSN